MIDNFTGEKTDQVGDLIDQGRGLARTHHLSPISYSSMPNVLYFLKYKLMFLYRPFQISPFLLGIIFLLFLADFYLHFRDELGFYL